ncbi:ATP-binding protein [Paenibacillus cellulositrophicus]|uniref:ATP-binding protein n=1 Tax=Paenibacillus cellulositrophicus TaxID=562959 RepID=UPI003D95B621
MKGNRSAEILTVGFAVFGLTVIGEMVWFYLKDGNYDLFLWKWGAAVFIISLMLILGRNYTINHEQIVKYSRELEMFNNELQRSEKMAIISELAASVAHEVRNPLQVTRGFLQVLTKKYRNQDKLYMTMALEELDRAAGIITDFLTFAKPQFERISVLNVKEELGHVEGVIVPLANLQGAQIDMRVPDHLQVKGNSSKFKQAFINMVKNSIEALNGDGQINVWAYEMDERVVIHIQDNGEGMSKEELARLGEPYFSNKTKGTGLGLMVTFRIVEAMGGSLEFKSEKGVGTEAVVSFPSAAV